MHVIDQAELCQKVFPYTIMTAKGMQVQCSGLKVKDQRLKKNSSRHKAHD